MPEIPSYLSIHRHEKPKKCNSPVFINNKNSGRLLNCHCNHEKEMIVSRIKEKRTYLSTMLVAVQFGKSQQVALNLIEFSGKHKLFKNAY